jgi:hypothetical protein
VRVTWPGARGAISIVSYFQSGRWNALLFFKIWAFTAVAGALLFVGLTWQVTRFLVVSASGLTGLRWRGKRIDLRWDQVTTFLPAADMRSGMRSPPAFEIHRGGGNLLLDFEGGETASLLAVLRYMPADHPARPAVEAATRKP